MKALDKSEHRLEKSSDGRRFNLNGSSEIAVGTDFAESGTKVALDRNNFESKNGEIADCEEEIPGEKAQTNSANEITTTFSVEHGNDEADNESGSKQRSSVSKLNSASCKNVNLTMGKNKARKKQSAEDGIIHYFDAETSKKREAKTERILEKEKKKNLSKKGKSKDKKG